LGACSGTGPCSWRPQCSFRRPQLQMASAEVTPCAVGATALQRLMSPGQQLPTSRNHEQPTHTTTPYTYRPEEPTTAVVRDRSVVCHYGGRRVLWRMLSCHRGWPGLCALPHSRCWLYDPRLSTTHAWMRLEAGRVDSLISLASRVTVPCRSIACGCAPSVCTLWYSWVPSRCACGGGY